MFNVTKSLKKLDEHISIGDNAIGDGAYFHIRLKDLREILLAGQDDKPSELNVERYSGHLCDKCLKECTDVLEDKISIPRSVAVGWLDKGDSSKELANAIKQALKG